MPEFAIVRLFHGHDGRGYDLRMRMHQAGSGRTAVVFEKYRMFNIFVLPVFQTTVAKDSQQVTGHVGIGLRRNVLIVIGTFNNDFVKTHGGDLIV